MTPEKIAANEKIVSEAFISAAMAVFKRHGMATHELSTNYTLAKANADGLVAALKMYELCRLAWSRDRSLS